MFNQILVAYDGSEHATNALGYAARLAKTYGADLHLSHIPQTETPAIVVGALIAPLEHPPSTAQIEEAGRALLATAADEAEAHGTKLAGTHSGTGDPARAILSTADDVDADLIVMGRRGLGAIGALALGSVSQAVSHGAKCACLTVL